MAAFPIRAHGIAGGDGTNDSAPTDGAAGKKGVVIVTVLFGDVVV